MKKNKKKQIKKMMKEREKLHKLNVARIKASKPKRKYTISAARKAQKLVKDYTAYKAAMGNAALPKVLYESKYRKLQEKGIKDPGKHILFQEENSGMTIEQYEARRNIIRRNIEKGDHTGKKSNIAIKESALNMNNSALKAEVSKIYNEALSAGLTKKEANKEVHKALYVGEE